MGTEVPKALVFYDNNTPQDVFAEIFTHQLFGSVRSVLINNEPWFIGSDVARCLGYERANDAITTHVYNEDKYLAKYGEIPYLKLPPRGAYIINESGLYSLILRSNMPAARQFQHWVTSEVLPAMRQIGFTKSMSILREENERLKQEILNKDNQIYELNTRIDSMHNNILKDNYNIDNIYNSNLSDKEKYILLNDM